MFWFNDDKIVHNTVSNTTNVTNVTNDNPITNFLKEVGIFILFMAMFWVIGWMVYYVFIFPIKNLMWYATDQKVPYSRVLLPHGGFIAQACYGMLWSFLMMTAAMGGVQVGDFDYPIVMYSAFIFVCCMMLIPAIPGVIRDIRLE